MGLHCWLAFNASTGGSLEVSRGIWRGRCWVALGRGQCLPPVVFVSEKLLRHGLDSGVSFSFCDHSIVFLTPWHVWPCFFLLPQLALESSGTLERLVKRYTVGTPFHVDMPGPRCFRPWAVLPMFLGAV